MNLFIPKVYAQGAAEAAAAAQDETLFNVLLTVFDFGKNVLLALLLLFAFYLFSKVLSSYVINKLRATQGETLHEDVVILVRRMISVGIIAIGVGIAFQFVLGFDILQLIGFFGLGVGFAFKDILSNLLAGVIVLMQGRFHIGDLIEIGGKKGKVVEIQTRSTILKAFDGTEIIIPNADFLKKTVTSFTTNPTRRVTVEVGVHYKTDTELACKIITGMLSDNPHVLKSPQPSVIATSFGDSAIMLAVKFWVTTSGGPSWIKVRSEVVHSIRKAFEQSGITIPFPIRTVHTGTEHDGLGWQGVEHDEAPIEQVAPSVAPQEVSEQPVIAPETPEQVPQESEVVPPTMGGPEAISEPSQA